LVTTILIQGAVANPLDYNPAESPSRRLCGDPMLFGHSAGTRLCGDPMLFGHSAGTNLVNTDFHDNILYGFCDPIKLVYDDGIIKGDNLYNLMDYIEVKYEK